VILKFQKPLYGILQAPRVNATNRGRTKKVVGDFEIAEDKVNCKWPAPLIITVNDYQSKVIDYKK
jgi:hypothetical protein